MCFRFFYALLSIVNHLAALHSAASCRGVALDHVGVLRRVATAIVRLFGHLGRCVAIAVGCRLFGSCHSLAILDVRLSADRLGATAASAAHGPAREHLHLGEAAAAHRTHRLHLFEHAAAAHAAETTAEAAAEEVVIIVKHAEASERIPAPLLLLLSSSLPASAHPVAKAVVEEVFEWVTPAEESLEQVVCLSECEVRATSATATETLEKGRSTTEAGASAASTTLL